MSTHTRTLAALATIGTFACAPPTHASERDFPFTYDWTQAAQGEKELETRTAYTRRNNTLAQEIELEYGVTRRFSVAPYVVFKREMGQGLHYDAVKLETRYQLGDYTTNRILTGLYLEVEKAHDEPTALEGKVILSRYGKDGSNLSFNLVAERPLEKSEYETTYSVGYARPVGRNGTRAGAELIHELTSGRINLGPVVGVAAGRDIRVLAGYAFALNRSDDNKDEIRLLTEYEF